MTTEELRQQILQLVTEYTRQRHAQRAFVPGESVIPASGKVFGAEEVCNAVDASLDFWLTTGRFNAEFERKSRRVSRGALGRHHQLRLVGQPARHCRAYLAQARRPRPALPAMRSSPSPPAFPPPSTRRCSTDSFPSLSMSISRLTTFSPLPSEAAITAKTRAIMVAHTLGNPFNLAEVLPHRKGTQSLAHRGLLRRPRLALQRPARRLLRRHCHPQLLSRPPHHHGRGRRRLLQ